MQTLENAQEGPLRPALNWRHNYRHPLSKVGHERLGGSLWPAGLWLEWTLVRLPWFVLKMPVLTFRGDIRCSLGHRRSGQKRLGLLPWARSHTLSLLPSHPAHFPPHHRPLTFRGSLGAVVGLGTADVLGRGTGGIRTWEFRV